MSQERISAAITRIEQALARLEQRPMAVESSTDFAALEARHAGLKSATTAAIRQIDGLLGELDRADG